MAITLPADVLALAELPRQQNPFEQAHFDYIFHDPGFTMAPERPRRAELISRFFPEIRQQLLPSEREAIAQLSLRSSEAILADFISQYDRYRAWADHEPGILHVSLDGPEHTAFWMSIEDIHGDIRQTHVPPGDDRTREFLVQVLDAIKRYDSADYALIVLTDYSTTQLFPIRRDNPAKSLEAMFEEHLSL